MFLEHSLPLFEARCDSSGDWVLLSTRKCSENKRLRLRLIHYSKVDETYKLFSGIPLKT